MPILNPDYSNLNVEEMATAIGLKAKHIPILVEAFKEETLELLEKLQSAIINNDIEAIHAAAHSIKGSAANLRFTEIYEMSKELEYTVADTSNSFEYLNYFNAIKSSVDTIKI